MHGNGRARLSVLPIADFDAHRQPAIAGATRVRNVMLGYALLTNDSNVEKNHRDCGDTNAPATALVSLLSLLGKHDKLALSLSPEKT